MPLAAGALSADAPRPQEAATTPPSFPVGLRVNRPQVAQLMTQVLLVGFALGMTRTVVPALAESEFGVARGSFLLLRAFVLAFGVVKALMNFVAGRLSERVGRRQVPILGWVVALPVPVLIWATPGWDWIVAATALPGINQGLCWSMTQSAKLDLARADERGLAMGLNEFAGYAGVVLAGIATAVVAEALGARVGLLVFGLAVVLVALALSVLAVRETLPWARAEAAAHRASPPAALPRFPRDMPDNPTTAQVFAIMTWRDRRLFAIAQAGHVEKFVDALFWAILPGFLLARGTSLAAAGWIVGTYGFVWGGAQLVTGRISDRVGRFWPKVLGMWICGFGVAMMVLGAGALWWALSAGVAGLGMALLYPNLSAAVADITPPAGRGSAIGIYRFWRDRGYAVGALGIGLAAGLTGSAAAAFWFVAAAFLLSGAVLWWFGEETHPRLNPARG